MRPARHAHIACAVRELAARRRFPACSPTAGAAGCAPPAPACSRVHRRWTDVHPACGRAPACALCFGWTGAASMDCAWVSPSRGTSGWGKCHCPTSPRAVDRVREVAVPPGLCRGPTRTTTSRSAAAARPAYRHRRSAECPAGQSRSGHRPAAVAGRRVRRPLRGARRVVRGGGRLGLPRGAHHTEPGPRTDVKTPCTVLTRTVQLPSRRGRKAVPSASSSPCVAVAATVSVVSPASRTCPGNLAGYHCLIVGHIPVMSRSPSHASRPPTDSELRESRNRSVRPGARDHALREEAHDRHGPPARPRSPGFARVAERIAQVAALASRLNLLPRRRDRRTD